MVSCFGTHICLSTVVVWMCFNTNVCSTMPSNRTPIITKIEIAVNKKLAHTTTTTTISCHEYVSSYTQSIYNAIVLWRCVKLRTHMIQFAALILWSSSVCLARHAMCGRHSGRPRAGRQRHVGHTERASPRAISPLDYADVAELPHSNFCGKHATATRERFDSPLAHTVACNLYILDGIEACENVCTVAHHDLFD